MVFCNRNHANKEGCRFCTSCGEPLPLAAGQIIDSRYRIIRQLGQGGFGRTYLAEDNQQSYQRYVLKEFAPQVQTPEELQKAKELFKREAKVLTALEHAQIPRCYDYLSIKTGNRDFFFLVQEYIEGETYQKLLKQRRQQCQAFSEAEITRLFKEVLPVLSYIHSRGVIHRDISPDNLMWRRRDELPVLIDFGGVKELPLGIINNLGIPQSHTLLGKKYYSPDEQMQLGNVRENSDLYSLAVTALVVLLTGKEPEEIYNSYEGVWDWEKIPVNEQMKKILKKMLAEYPRYRYQRSEDVLGEITGQSNPIGSKITRIKTLVVAPGLKKVQERVSKLQSPRKSLPVLAPWIRPFIITLVVTPLVVLTSAGTWAVVKSMLTGVGNINVPKILLPGVNQNENYRIEDVIRRQQKLEISDVFLIQLVDFLFYRANPDLKGRSLNNSSADTSLRQEWVNLAGELLNKIEQANLSTIARRQLGKYSDKHEMIWKRQARAGVWGNYTIKQLYEDTNTKFDNLFPGEGGGQLNQATLKQVWYAIATDKISQVKSRQ